MLAEKFCEVKQTYFLLLSQKPPFQFSFIIYLKKCFLAKKPLKSQEAQILPNFHFTNGKAIAAPSHTLGTGTKNRSTKDLNGS